MIKNQFNINQLLENKSFYVVEDFILAERERNKHNGLYSWTGAFKEYMVDVIYKGLRR